MKLAIVGSVGIPATYGGFETLVEHLVEDSNFEFMVYCSGRHYKERLSVYKNAKLVYLPIKANGLMSIFYDVLSILHGLIMGHKRFLILGTSGAIFIPLVRFFCPGVKMFVNIDGVEWQRSKWHGLAKAFLKLSEGIAIKYSHSVIADNDAIADYIMEVYNRDCRIIAYGGDHAVFDTGEKHHLQDIKLNKPYVLAISRIEPENNVHVVLEAFAESGKALIFIGNWSSTAYGRDLFAQYKAYSAISLLEPIYDQKKLAVYRSNCRAYVHGHSAGGTNPSLVEMMHFARPIVAYDCPYNRASMENRGSYFSNSEELSNRLNALKVNNDQEMSAIASRKYTWDIIRQQYAELYT